MEVNEIKKDIAACEIQKFENIISLCSSHIEKKFIGNLYHFFKANDFHPTYEMISEADVESWDDTKLLSLWNYIQRHSFRRLNLKFVTNVELGEEWILCGFNVKCYDVIYRFFPQFPIYDTNTTRYADFVVEVMDLAGNTLKNFIIECDGFSFHSTRSQINNDNDRTLFLSAHGYTVIRYTSSKIEKMTAKTIINLENLFYHSIFKKNSNLFNVKTM